MASNESFTVHVDIFESRWAMHPDANVDLCALPVAPLQEFAQKAAGKSIYYEALGDVMIPSPTELGELAAVEDVIMAGYPLGLWDDVNNLPLLRRGITASHPAVNFLGRSEGAVDLACFPGSSGSPILIMGGSHYGDAAAKERKAIFLGVLWGGPIDLVEGHAKMLEGSSSTEKQGALVVSKVFVHLGYYVKSSQLSVFRDFAERWPVTSW